MGPEMVIGIIGSLMALAIAVNALRGARSWHEYMKRGGPPPQKPDGEEPPPRDPGRPWGG